MKLNIYLLFLSTINSCSVFFFVSIRQPYLHLVTRAIRSTCQVRKTASPSGPCTAVRSVEVQPSVELIEVVIYRRHWQAKSFGEARGSVTRPDAIQCNIFILKSANVVMEQHLFFGCFFYSFTQWYEFHRWAEDVKCINKKTNGKVIRRPPLVLQWDEAAESFRVSSAQQRPERSEAGLPF